VGQSQIKRVSISAERQCHLLLLFLIKKGRRKPSPFYKMPNRKTRTSDLCNFPQSIGAILLGVAQAFAASRKMRCGTLCSLPFLAPNPPTNKSSRPCLVRSA
jgi:hypothetical protein